jgi:hypothetical protein
MFLAYDYVRLGKICYTLQQIEKLVWVSIYMEGKSKKVWNTAPKPLLGLSRHSKNGALTKNNKSIRRFRLCPFILHYLFDISR